MKKNPIRSAILWFLGVGMLTGSGFLGMIAAFIAYNATRDEMLRDEQRQSQNQAQQYYQRQQRPQVNPWTQQQWDGRQAEAVRDVRYETQQYGAPQQHVSLRPDEEPAETVQAAAAEPEPESGFAVEGKRYIASLRLAKASIDNKEVQAKITELEKIIESIYARVEEKPEQTAEVRAIMEKTMPLTTGVLDSYAEMNLRRVQGQDFTKMEKDVIDLLDKTRIAYTRLHDNLYDGDIMDVTSDINVLKTLLSQEGLLGGDFENKKEQEGELRRQTQ